MAKKRASKSIIFLLYHRMPRPYGVAKEQTTKVGNDDAKTLRCCGGCDEIHNVSSNL